MSTAQSTVIILSNLSSMFNTMTEIMQGSSQNIGFGQNTRISNPGWQPFENLRGNNPPAENNNFNNLSPLLLPINLFGNIEGFNLLSNNNNNLLPEGLDPNVAAKVSTLTVF